MYLHLNISIKFLKYNWVWQRSITKSIGSLSWVMISDHQGSTAWLNHPKLSNTWKFHLQMKRQLFLLLYLRIFYRKAFSASAGDCVWARADEPLRPILRLHWSVSLTHGEFRYMWIIQWPWDVNRFSYSHDLYVPEYMENLLSSTYAICFVHFFKINLPLDIWMQLSCLAWPSEAMSWFWLALLQEPYSWGLHVETL